MDRGSTVLLPDPGVLVREKYRVNGSAAAARSLPLLAAAAARAEEDLANDDVEAKRGVAAPPARRWALLLCVTALLFLAGDRAGDAAVADCLEDEEEEFQPFSRR